MCSFSGLGFNITDDYELLKARFVVIYDALYSWVKHLAETKHLENSPFEKLLHEVYLKLLSSREKQPPKWVTELREIIQDHLDAQYYNIDLKQVSDEVDLNASYLSREFSKYFDDKNFAEYIRSARIEKAIALLANKEYTLTEIAYLTGFSDQSHFTRIFKRTTGQNPSFYRKHLLKK